MAYLPAMMCPKNAALAIGLLLLFASCAAQRGEEGWPSQSIAVGAGPEDMVLDVHHGAPRLIVSCHDRRTERDGAEGIGGFWGIDLETREAFEFARMGEPDTLYMKPHGIDFVETSDGFKLYAIVHDDRKSAGKKGKHRIVVYTVFEDLLVYDTVYQNDRLLSPNALCALPDGGLLVTNDSKKRGSKMEGLLKRKTSSIVYWNPHSGSWSVVAERLSYANGIVHKGGQVYVATSRQNLVFSYRFDDGKLLDRKSLGKVPGGDNLRWDGEDLLTMGHPNMVAFVRHAGNADKDSPVELWRVAADGGSAPQRIWSDDGTRISGASTAIAYNGSYWICQVFDPFVLVLDPPADQVP